MPLIDNLLPLTLWVLSILIFPTSLAFIMVLYENKSWCFADECLEGKAVHRTPIRALAGIFYGYLLLTAIVAIAARRMERIRNALGRTLWTDSTVTIAEVAWFVGMILLVFPIFLWSVWGIYWGNEQAKIDRATAAKTLKPWVSYFYEALTYISGDMSAVLIGFLLIPTSKNSVIAHYLRLPYTTTVRLHRWIGWTLAFSSCLHLVLSMMWKAIDDTPLYQLFFTLPANTKWGSEKYRYVTAFPALLFLGIVVIMALPYVRRNFYNAFIISHLFGIPFMAFAYFHDSIDIYFAIPALLLYAVDLALRFGAWFTLTPVTSVSHEESGYKIVTVPYTKPVLPGQFMRVVVPNASRWEAHPWSVTSTSPGSVKFLVGPVKRKNEWTERVFQYLEFTKSGGSASVSLQGPYGNPVLFATEEQRHDAYVFLVAGSGISPAIAAIEHLLNRFFEDGSLQSAHGKVQLVWSTGRPSAERLTPLAQWMDKESPVQVTIHDTSVERMDQAPEGVVRRGRLNARHVMHKVVDAAVSWSEAGGAPRVAVFVCGPGSFAGQVVADITSVEKERGVRFSTHVESFEI